MTPFTGTHSNRVGLKGDAGTSLVEVMVGASVLTVITVGLLQFLTFLTSQQSKATSTVQLDLIRRNLIALASSSSSWTNTITNPVNATAMSCLASHTPCTKDGSPTGAPIQNQPFALFDGSAASQPYYNALPGNNGVTPAGVFCDGYPIVTNHSNLQSPSQNTSCVYRFDLKWSAICTPGNCVNPQVKISAILLKTPTSAGNAFNLNPANYSVAQLFRSAQ